MTEAHLANLPPPPTNPQGTAPLRRPGSVRRTSSIDMTWPEGRTGSMHMLARGRDLLTPADGGAAQVLALDEVSAILGWDRAIQKISSSPPRAEVQKLVGEKGGGRLRGVLEHVLPREKAEATPLYLLLDDISGASLIGGWAWSRWMTDWMRPGQASEPEPISPAAQAVAEQARAALAAAAASADAPGPQVRNMENICTGFQSGSSALNRDGSSSPQQSATKVGPLPNPNDPLSWHDLPEFEGVWMRRARRIDVWLEAGIIHIESMFQDSASLPEGGRAAVHEYRLGGTADLASGKLTSVAADPRILPYRECPLAPRNIDRMIGRDLRDFRTLVLEELRRQLGCTHLNDALRALAEAPALARNLEVEPA
jgi:hypothetical protein